MGKIKGWNNIRIAHQPNPKSVSWVEYVWINKIDYITIEITKLNLVHHYGKYKVYIYSPVGRIEPITEIKRTKKQAKDFAMKYMRGHPNG